MQSATWPELWTRSILLEVMIPGLDIYRSAHVLVKRHGSGGASSINYPRENCQGDFLIIPV